MSIPEVDPSLTYVPLWVDTVLGAVSDLLAASVAVHGSVGVSERRALEERRDELAWRCAVAIAARRLASNPPLFFAWFASLCWAEEPSDRLSSGQLTAMRGQILVNLGLPGSPSSDSHVCGLVAECLWYELTTNEPVDGEMPVLVEGHQWSVTDPGGDGLAVYRRPDSSLHFHLCESKAHYGGGALTPTVQGAAHQLRRRGLDYLGRFSVVAQRVTDDEVLAAFLCTLSEKWADASPDAGVGVSVTSSSPADGEECFSTLPNYFSLAADRHHGLLHVVGELIDFASLVRRYLWQGAGLCNVH
jgi:hypothetical protein